MTWDEKNQQLIDTSVLKKISMLKHMNSENQTENVVKMKKNRWTKAKKAAVKAAKARKELNNKIWQI